MKRMKLFHYLVLALILVATLFGVLVFACRTEILEQIKKEEPVMQTGPVPEVSAATPTEAPTDAPTEAPTEPPTEPPTEAPTEAPTEPPTEPAPQSFLLTFVGDCTLGCNAKMVNVKTAFPLTVGDDYDYSMANVKDYFLNDDCSFANLEGTLGGKGKAQNKKYVFTGKAEYTEILTRNGVESVTLANNHSFDFGQEGLDETKAVLENAGIPYAEHMGTVTVTTDSGLTVGMFAVDFNRGTPRKEEVKTAIRNLKDSGVDLVVCAFHWGRENTFQATSTQKEYGKLAIDAGAAIVWGHHPHVLQPMETYKDGLIMYSLGNFVFGGNSVPKDFDTAIVQQEVIRDVDGSITLGKCTVIPCSVSSASYPNNYQPTPYQEGSMEYDRAVSKLNATYKGSSLPIG